MDRQNMQTGYFCAYDKILQAIINFSWQYTQTKLQLYQKERKNKFNR